MLDILRGGVPAPVRMPLGGLSGTSVNAVYDLNVAYTPKYDSQFLNFWTITKEQLNIFIGLELFYGNYSEYLAIYIARLHDTLAELLSTYSQVQKLPKEAEKAMLSGGIQAVESTMAQFKEVSTKLKELQEFVSENITTIAEEVGMSTDDLLEVLEPYLASENQENNPR